MRVSFIPPKPKQGGESWHYARRQLEKQADIVLRDKLVFDMAPKHDRLMQLLEIELAKQAKQQKGR